MVGDVFNETRKLKDALEVKVNILEAPKSEEPRRLSNRRLLSKFQRKRMRLNVCIPLGTPT